MHNTLDFYPRPDRKEMNVPQHIEKPMAYCPDVHIYTVAIATSIATGAISIKLVKLMDNVKQ